MTSLLPEETGIVAALRDGRIVEALEVWKAFRLENGMCEQGLCENRARFGLCCANRLRGWLLTAAMSEKDGDYKLLERRLEAWLDTQDDVPCHREGGGNGEGRVALTPALMVGHPEIDEDHRFLVHCIDSISDALEEDDFEAVHRLLAAFTRSLDSHFHREEEIMAAANYGGLAGHATAHEAERRALGDLRRLAEAVEKGEVSKEGLANRLVAFLLDDAIKADLGFKTHLIRHGLLD